jgi:predicted DNA-binding transcriptional regulator
MSFSFDDLLALSRQGLSLSAILVHAFLEEHGVHPASEIAAACDISERTVYLAISQIKKRSVG